MADDCSLRAFSSLDSEDVGIRSEAEIEGSSRRDPLDFCLGVEDEEFESESVVDEEVESLFRRASRRDVSCLEIFSSSSCTRCAMWRSRVLARVEFVWRQRGERSALLFGSLERIEVRILGEIG